VVVARLALEEVLWRLRGAGELDQGDETLAAQGSPSVLRAIARQLVCSVSRQLSDMGV